MKNKPVEFKTKIFHNDIVYLKLSDVIKALRYKRKDFMDKYSQLIEKISNMPCIKETDYNNLLAENEKALSQQGQIEITKIETLRSKVNTIMSFQPLKVAFARNYLQMMATRTGCKTIEEYILMHELPKEKRKEVETLIRQNETSRKHYQKMIDYLNDKESFDVEKVKSFGLDLQYLTSIKSDGRLNLDMFVVGQGVFHRVTNLGDYELWNDLHLDDNGHLILPSYNYDYQEEQLINLSETTIDRDFSKYNAVENTLWCIENLKVEAMEDYEHSVFSMYGDTIKFDMSLELLVKLIRPDMVETIYVDNIIDFETGMILTEFEKEKVFEEDFRNKN